jgi:HlyD family secretion protein
MSKTLKWILISLGALIGLLLILKMTGVIGKTEDLKVAVEKSSRKTIIELVSASGKVYPEVEVKVSPDVSGEIVELNVEEGDSVTKGQVLARIYADIYGSQRDQAAAVVAQQMAQVENAVSALNAAKARLDQATSQYYRQKKLFDDKVISKSEFEQAESAYKTAKADYASAEQVVKSSQAAVKNAQAGLNRASKDVGRTVITAPMSGVVSILNVKKGERVAGNSFNVGTEMMRISDLSVYEVRVDVGENDIVKVHMGDTALVEVDAYNNRKFKGIVSKIASSSSSLSSSAGSSDATNYKVHIRLMADSYKDLIDPAKPKSFPFRPGMSASADIQTKTKFNVLSVPINAVAAREKSDTGKNKQMAQEKKKDNDENKADELDEVVFVVQKDGTVKRVKVTTGIQDINNIEILTGLNEGEEVVIAPYSAISKTLKDGTKVKVVPKDQLYEKDK